MKISSNNEPGKRAENTAHESKRDKLRENMQVGDRLAMIVPIYKHQAWRVLFINKEHFTAVNEVGAKECVMWNAI